MLKKRTDTIVRTIVALIYFQVNVAWGAAPSVSMPLSFGETVSSVLHGATALFHPIRPRPRAFVFREIEDPDKFKPPKLPEGADGGAPKDGAKAPAKAAGVEIEDIAPKGAPLTDKKDLKGPVGTFVREKVLNNKGPDGLKLEDVKIDALPVADSVKTVLRNAPADAKVEVRTDGGNVVLKVDGLGAIKVKQDGMAAMAASVTPEIAAAAAKADAAPGAAKPPVKPGDAKPVVPKPAEAKAPKPADAVRIPVNNVNALAGLGYKGALGNAKITKAEGAWVVKTDPATGQKTKTFEGTVTWETKSGMQYTAKGTADGKVQLTRVATGTFNGRDVSKGGKVVETEFANGRKSAETTFHVGDSETRVNGTLTSFEATNGPILRQVFQPQAGAARRGGAAAEEPQKLAGAKGEYVIREGGLDSVFKMAGGAVQLDRIKDAKTGEAVVTRQVDGTMVGKLAGKDVKFQVLGGPRFDASGAAQINVNFIANKGDKAILPAQRAGPGNNGGGGGADPGHKYDGVSFQDLGAGKGIQVTAQKNGALMAGSIALGSGKSQLVQTGNITNSVFLDKAGNEAGRTLDDVKVKTADGKVSARPMIAITTNDKNTRLAFASVGIVNTTPFALPAGAAGIRGNVQIGKDGRAATADIHFDMPDGTKANLTIAGGKHELSVTAKADTKFDYGVAQIDVKAGTTAKIDLDAVFADKPALPAGVSVTVKEEPKKTVVTNLRALGIGLDARVTGGDVKVWVNPLTGNMQTTQGGKIQVAGPGFTGEVSFKDGRPSTLTFNAPEDGDAVLKFTGANGRSTTITVPGARPQNEGVTLNLQTGTFMTKNPADLPKFMAGVKIQTPQGLEMTFHEDAKAPGGVGVTLGDNEFGAIANTTVKPGQVAGARVHEGKVVIDLTPAGTINLKGPITVAPGRKDDGTVNNAQINRLEVNMLGGMTGIGQSDVEAGKKVFVAVGAPGAGGAGGGSPDLSGLTTKNMKIETVEGGQLLTAKAGGGKIAITVHDAGAGKMEGQVQLATQKFEGVTVKTPDGEKTTVAGIEFRGEVTFNRTDEKNMTFVAEKVGSTVATSGKAALTFTAVGQKASFVDGALKNDAKLAGTVLKLDGATVTFAVDPKDAKKVVASVTDLNTTFFGETVKQKDISYDGKPIPATLEGGQIKIHPEGSRVIGIWRNGVTDAAGKKVDHASMLAHTLAIDVLTGRKSAEGSIDLKKDETVYGPGEAPVQAKPGDAKAGEKSAPGETPTPPTAVAKDTGSNKIIVEDAKGPNGPDGKPKPLVKVTGVDWGSRVSGTLVEGEKGTDGKTGPSVFNANPLSDYAKDVRVGANGFTTRGKTYSRGVSFDTREMGLGNYKVNMTAGSTMVDNNTGLAGQPDTRYKETAEVDSVKSFVGGQLVEKGARNERDVADPRGGGNLLRSATQNKDLQSTGRIYGEGFVQGNFGPGFKADDHPQKVRVMLDDGQLLVMGGTEYKNTSGETKTIRGADGKDLAVPAGTSFTYIGLDFVGSRQVSVVKGGPITTEVASGPIESKDLPVELKGRGDVTALDPRSSTKIVYGEGGTRSVEHETTVKKPDGTREKLDPTVTSEIEVVKDKKSPMSRPDRPLPPAGQELIYVAQGKTGWSYNRTTLWSGPGYFGRDADNSFTFKGMVYDVKTTGYGTKDERSTLNVSQGSLKAATGKQATVVTNSGATYTGEVSQAVDAKGNALAGLYKVNDTGAQWVSGGNSRLDRGGVFIQTDIYGNSNVAWSAYNLKGDDGKTTAGFVRNEQTGEVTFFQENLTNGSLDLAVSGNTIQVRTDPTGKQTISTDIKAADGTAALVITTPRSGGTSSADGYTMSSGLHFGTVATLPSGTKVNAMSWGGKNVLDLSGRKVLQQTVTEIASLQPGQTKREATTYLLGTDVQLPNATVRADSRLMVNSDKSISLVKGFLAVNGGSQRLTFGERRYGEDSFQVMKAGGSGGPAGPSERIVFHYEGTGEENRQTMVMTSGEVFVGDGFVQVKPGTVLVNPEAQPRFQPGGMFSEGKVIRNPNYMRQVQGDGSLRYVIVSYKSSNEERAKDIREQAKNMKLDSGQFMTEKDKNGGKTDQVSVVIMDGGLNTIGSWNTSTKMERNFVGIASGQDYLEHGEVRLKTQDPDRKDYTDNTGEHKFLDVFRDDKDGNMTSGGGEIIVNHGIFKGQTVRERDGTVSWFRDGGKLEYTKIDFADGTVTRSATFTGTVFDRRTEKAVGEKSFDLTAAHNYFVNGKGAGNISEEKRDQAKTNLLSIGDTIEKAVTKRGESSIGADSLQGLVGRQISAFSFYSAPEASTFSGVKDFIHTVLITPTVYKDMIMGTDHASAMLEGKEGTPLGTLGELFGLKVNMRAETLKDNDKWVADVDALMSGKLSLEGAMGNFESRNSWSGNFLRQLDKGAGDLLGFNRIMNLDTSRISRAQGGWETAKETGRFLFHFSVCVGEQTLNFFTFGGGTLLTGGAKSGLYLTKAAYLAAEAEKAAQLAKAAQLTVTAVKGAEAVKAVSLVGRAFQAYGATKAFVNAVLFNRATTTLFTLMLRSKAADSVDKAIDVSVDKGVTSKEAVSAIGSAAKDVAMSEIALIAPALGSLVNGTKVGKVVGAITGFGSEVKTLATTRQALTVAVVGAGLSVANHYMNGGQNSVAGYLGAAAAGAASALVAYTVYRVLGGSVPGGKAAQEAVTVTRGAEGAAAAETAAAGRFSGLLAGGRAFAAGAAANVTLQGLQGNLKSDNIVKTALAGGVVGVLSYGVSKAISNWGTVAAKMKEGQTAGEILGAGQHSFKAESMKGALHIALWDMTANTVQWNGSLGWSGGNGLLNPLTWASALTQAIQGTGILGHAEPSHQGDGVLFSKANLLKGVGIFKDMGGMMGLFHFGRVGTTLGAGNVAGTVSQAAAGLEQRAAGNFLKAASAEGLSKAGYVALGVSQKVGAFILESGIAMPLNIHQFGAYEKLASNAANWTGLTKSMKSDASGKMFLTDEKGNFLLKDGKKVEASAGDIAAAKLVETAGFLSAPIAPMKSNAEKAVETYLAEAAPRASDVFLADGGAARRKAVRDFASKLRDAISDAGGRPVQVSFEGKESKLSKLFSPLSVENKTVTLSPESMNEVRAVAGSVISSDKAFQKAVIGRDIDTVEAVVHDGATARAIETDNSAAKVEVGWKAGADAPVAKADGTKGTAVGKTDGKTFAADIEVKTDVGGKSQTLKTDAKVELGADGTAKVTLGGEGAKLDKNSEVTLEFRFKGDGGEVKTVTVRGTLAEAEAGTLKVVEAGGAPVDSLTLSVHTLSEGRAAEVLADSTAAKAKGEAGPSEGLVKAAGERLGIEGKNGVTVIRVDADLHRSAGAQMIAAMSDDELKSLVSKVVDDKLAADTARANGDPVPPSTPVLFGALAATKLGGRSGQRAAADFASALEAGVAPELVKAIGTGKATIVKVGGEREIRGADGGKLDLSTVLTPEAIARLPEAVRNLAGGAEGVSLRLGGANEPIKIVFSGVENPVALFEGGMPKTEATGKESAEAAEAETAANPYARAEKYKLWDSGQKVDVAVAIDGKGARRYEINNANDRGGAKVVISDAGLKLKKVNVSQASRVMSAENSGKTASKEAQVVTAQLSAGKGRTADIDIGSDGIQDVRVGESFSLKNSRPTIKADVDRQAAAPPKLEDVQANVNAYLSDVEVTSKADAQQILDAGVQAKDAGDASGGGMRAYVDSVVDSFQKSDLTPQEKGDAVREIAKAATTPEQKRVAAELVFQVDRRGCSACMAKYTNPKTVAEAARAAIPGLARDMDSGAPDRVADGFVGDRLLLEATSGGGSRASPETLKEAAKILREGGDVRAADILDSVATRLSAGETVDVSATKGRDGEKIGKDEAAWLTAADNFHSVAMARLLAGKSLDLKDAGWGRTAKEFLLNLLSPAGSDRSLRRAAEKLDALEVKDTATQLRRDLATAEATSATLPEASRGAVRQQIETLKEGLGRLESASTGNKGKAKAVERARAIDRGAGAVRETVGSKVADAARLKEMREAADAMEPGAAKDAFESIIKLTEDHVNGYDAADGKTREQSLQHIADSFDALRKSYGLDKDLGRLDALFPKGKDAKPTKADRERVIADLFGGKKESELSAGERLAFILTVSDRYFNGPDKAPSTANDKERFDSGKRAALLVQFMLGRAAGLEAGGGKTALFPMAIAEFAMRNKAKGGDPFVAELVVFAKGEVQQYITKYQPLFRALGLEAVDGRNLNGPENREEALKAYTPDADVTKVIVTDMNTRGFRQNDIEREPNSDLAMAIRQNVKVKAADEVDAQVLSRMAFINSDGNLVAKPELVQRTQTIQDAVFSALGVTNGADALKATWSEAGGAGFREFGGKEVADLGQGVWFSKTGEAVHISDALMEHVEAKLKEQGHDDISSGEINEYVRALASVRNPTEFGFTREGREEGAAPDVNFRPTHKKGGEFQIGQIDSSPIFNVGAVLLERARRESTGEGTEGLDLRDVRLSKASASATLIQALQGGEGIHRFAATGTPEALDGIIQATLGMELRQVFSSSLDQFDQTSHSTVQEAFDAQRLLDGKTSRPRMTAGFVEANSAQARTKAASDGIGLSQDRGAGTLLGARNEADLKDVFYARLKARGASDGLVAEVKKGSQTLGIRDTIDLAKTLLLTDKGAGKFDADRGNDALTTEVRRSDVIDGNGGKMVKGTDGKLTEMTWADGETARAGGAVAEATAGEKKVVYSTEIGLRGMNFASKDEVRTKDGEKVKDAENIVDAIFMGLEGSSTETRLQAWKRVDRDRNAAFRLEIVNPSVLRNRVETAKKVDESLKNKFNRPEGLFAGKGKVVNDAIAKPTEEMSVQEMVAVAGGLTSLENLGQSAMFFINEQVESKLLKEPIASWKAQETGEEGKAFLASLQIDILEHSDKKDISRGTEYTDPRLQALNAFSSGAARAIDYLTRVKNNESVSPEIRAEAASRIADIIDAQRGIKQSLDDVNPSTGRHDSARFQEAAFVNVSADVNGRPAQQVADAVVRLSDLLLPSTRTSVEAAGPAEAPTRAVVTGPAEAGPVAKPTAATDAEFLGGIKVGKDAKPVAEGEGRTLSYHEQGLYVALQTLTGMSKSQRAAVVPALVAAGLVDAASTDDDKKLAASLVRGLTAAGAEESSLNIPAVIQAATDLTALAGTGKVTAADVVAVASAKTDSKPQPAAKSQDERRETLAATVLRVNGFKGTPKEAAASANPVVAAAGRVLVLTAGRRAERAAQTNKPEGANDLTTLRYYARAIFNNFFSSSSKLDKMAETPLGGALGADLKTPADGKRDPAKIADRWTAMAVLMSGATGDQRTKIGKVMKTLADVLVGSGSFERLVSRIEFGDVAKVAAAADPVAALRELIKSKDGPSMYQPVKLWTPVKVAAKGVALLAPIALFAGSAIAATVGLPVMLGIAGLAVVATALTTDKNNPDPISAALKKAGPALLGLASALTDFVLKYTGVTAVTGLTAKTIGGAVQRLVQRFVPEKARDVAVTMLPTAFFAAKMLLLGGTVWPVLAAAAPAIGSLLGKDLLKGLPLIGAVPGFLHTPAMRAVDVLQSAQDDVASEKKALFDGDDTLKGLQKQLAAAPADQKSAIQGKINDRKAELLAAHPVEGVTLKRLQAKVEELAPEKDRATVLKLALQLFNGTDGDKGDRIDEVLGSSDKTKKSLGNLDLSDVLDPDQKLDQLEVIGDFVGANEGGEITVGGIDDEFENPSTDKKGLTPNDVVRHFGGEDLSDEEIDAMRAVEGAEGNLRNGLKPATPANAEAAATDNKAPARNEVAPLAEAVRNDGVQTRAAEIVAEARPSQPVAEAARAVAAEKSEALQTISYLLENAGVSPTAVRALKATLLQNPERNGQVDAAINAAIPADASIGGVDVRATLVNILDNNYYNGTRIGLASVRADGTAAPAGDVALVAAVANPAQMTSAKQVADTWDTAAPFYQAASVLGVKGTVHLEITGDTAKLSRVTPFGEKQEPFAKLTRTPTGRVSIEVTETVKVAGVEDPVKVVGTVEVRPVGGAVPGLVVVARPADPARVRVETRAPDAKEWTAVEGTQIPAGNQFRFVPIVSEGQKVDDRSARVYQAPKLPAPQTSAPAKENDEDKGATAPRPAGPAEGSVRPEPVGVGPLFQALLPAVDGAARPEPAQTLAQTERLFAEPVTAPAPTGAKPNLLVQRDGGGAVVAVFALSPADNKWHGVQQTPDGPKVTEPVAAAPTGERMETYYRTADAVTVVKEPAPIAAAKTAPEPEPAAKSAPTEGRTLLQRLFGPVVRWVAPALVLAAMAFGGSKAPAAEPVAPLAPTAAKVAPVSVFREGPAAAPGLPAGEVKPQEPVIVGNLRSKEPVTVMLPTSDGRSQKIVLEQPAATFQMVREMTSRDGGEGERLFVMIKRTDGDGVAHLTPGRPLRAVEFADVPEGGTPALVVLASELAVAPAKNPVTEGVDKPAIENVDRLLTSAFSGWMGSLKAGKLLQSVLASPTEGSVVRQRFAPQIARLEEASKDKGGLAAMTYKDIAAVVGDETEFMGFAKQLIAYNAETVSAPKTSILPSATLLSVREKEAGEPVVFHTHPNQAEPSGPDQVTAGDLAAFGKENGFNNGGPVAGVASMVNGEPALTLLSADDITTSAITPRGAIPLRPGQRFDATTQFIMAQPTSEVPAFFPLLPKWMQRFLVERGIVRAEGLRVFNLSNEGDRAAAMSMLDATSKLIQSGADAGIIRLVYQAAYELATGQITDDGLNALLANVSDNRIPLKQLIQNLSKQFGNSAGLLKVGQNPANLGLVAQKTELLVHADERFGSVVALPSRLTSAGQDNERLFQLDELGNFRLTVMTPKEAVARAEEIQRQIDTDSDFYPRLMRKLGRLAGVGTEDFAARLRAAAQAEGYEIPSDVEAIFEGKVPGATPEQQRRLQAKALSLLFEPFAQAAVKAVGLPMENEDLRDAVANVKISVVDPTELKGLAGGQGLWDPTSDTIYESVDPKLPAAEAFGEEAGILIHELGHVFDDMRAHDTDSNPYEGATLLEEGGAQLVVSQVAKALGLEEAALLGERDTCRRIAATENAEVVCLLFGDQVRKNADKLKKEVETSKGLHAVDIVTTSDGETRAAAFLFAHSGVRVVPLMKIVKLRPLAQRSPLETHVMLEFGTYRVRFALDETMEKLVALAKAASADVPALIRFAITPLGASGPALELLMPIGEFVHLFDGVTERLLKQQA